MDATTKTYMSLTLLPLLLSTSPKIAGATLAPGSSISGQDLELTVNSTACAGSLAVRGAATSMRTKPLVGSFAKTVGTFVLGRRVKTARALSAIAKGALGFAVVPCTGIWNSGLSLLDRASNADNSQSFSLTDEQFQELLAETVARLANHHDNGYRQYGLPDDGLRDPIGPRLPQATGERAEKSVGGELLAEELGVALREGFRGGVLEIQREGSCHLGEATLAPGRSDPGGSAGRRSDECAVRAVAPAVGPGRERKRRPRGAGSPW